MAHKMWDNETTQQRRALIDRWFCEQFAGVLRRLNAVPEGDGTMLDNTVVLFANGMADGFWHAIRNVPWMVAGGKGVLKPKNFLNFATGSGNSTKFIPHIRLLRTLVTGFQMPNDDFADMSYGEDLPGVLA